MPFDAIKRARLESTITRAMKTFKRIREAPMTNPPPLPSDSETEMTLDQLLDDLLHTNNAFRDDMGDFAKLRAFSKARQAIIDWQATYIREVVSPLFWERDGLRDKLAALRMAHLEGNSEIGVGFETCTPPPAPDSETPEDHAEFAELRELSRGVYAEFAANHGIAAPSTEILGESKLREALEELYRASHGKGDYDAAHSAVEQLFREQSQEIAELEQGGRAYPAENESIRAEVSSLSDEIAILLKQLSAAEDANELYRLRALNTDRELTVVHEENFGLRSQALAPEEAAALVSGLSGYDLNDDADSPFARGLIKLRSLSTESPRLSSQEPDRT